MQPPSVRQGGGPVPGPQAVRPAATVMIVRDADGGSRSGIEVLMVRRNPRSAFVGGAHVFPGGALGPEDAGEVVARCAGRDDLTASAILGLPSGGLAFWVAAIRECFEEAGILLAYRRTTVGDLLSLHDPVEGRRMAHLRASLNSGRTEFADLCLAEDLCLATDRVHYFGHWVTPEGAPRRFDTRFFVTAAPPDQTPVSDAAEIVDELWIDPGEALRRRAEGTMQIVVPTFRMLQAIRGFASTADLLAAAEAAAADPPAIPPYRVEAGNGVRIPLPGDGPAGVSRPARTRQGPDEPAEGPPPSPWPAPGPLAHPAPASLLERGVGPVPVPGRPVPVAEGVVRVTAPNPGMMTGPGTNTYLVGRSDLAVVDPGPDDPRHLEAVLAAVDAQRARVRWVLVTHTHADHAPGTAALAARTGAEVVAFGPSDGFSPDRTVGDGWVLDAPGLRLRAVHTPGHASDHLCWLVEGPALLLTGDHVMHGSTVVIRPPDGDMGVYLASVERLLRRDPPFVALAPGHGRVMRDPTTVLRQILEHRADRERSVAAVLAAADHGTVDELLPLVYGDVPEDRLPVARYSLWAHLRKLAAEGRADVVWDGRPGGAGGAGATGDGLDATWSATPATAPAETGA